METENFAYAINNYTGEYEMMYLRNPEETYYLYIVEEVEGRFGPQLLAVVDGLTTIYALPTIKAFNDGLSVGCFYKIIYLGEYELDNGYTKHEYMIKEISETQYLLEAPNNIGEKSY
jgi:hypothetical protein